MGVEEDEHKRKPDLVQIEEFYQFTEIQSEILENLKPSLSASWAEFLQNSMLLPQPVNGPQVQWHCSVEFPLSQCYQKKLNKWWTITCTTNRMKQASLEDFKDYFQLGNLNDFSSCGDGDGRLVSGDLSSYGRIDAP